MEPMKEFYEKQATGVCSNCLSPDCICAHTIITRSNRIPGRIKVILMGEAFGYWPVFILVHIILQLGT